MVFKNGRACKTCIKRGEDRKSEVPPETTRKAVYKLASEYQGLDDQPADLVGAHDSAGWRNRCARHVVFVGFVAVRDAWLAGEDARSHHVLSDECADKRSRNCEPVGCAHDILGARIYEEGPVPRFDCSRDGFDERRKTNVQVARYRH